MQTKVLAEVKANQVPNFAADTTQLDKVSFVWGDATKAPYVDLKFSHVYMYDRLFTDNTMKQLANNLNGSDVRVLLSYQVRALLSKRTLYVVW